MNREELFIDINNLPKRLSVSEERELLKQISNGSEEAKKELITHNIRLVIYKVVYQYKNVDYSQKDLIQIGNIGLINAANNFDMSKGYEFATYASKCIDNEILMHLRKIKKDKNLVSIETTTAQKDNGRKLTLQDHFKEDIDIEGDYERKILYQNMNRIINGLTDRERKAINLSFGFNNDKIYTQEEIAAEFGFSQSYASRVIRTTVKKIRDNLEEQGLIDLKHSNYDEQNRKITFASEPSNYGKVLLKEKNR